MKKQTSRRTFIKVAAVAIGMPTIIPASALGKNGTVAPSNRLVMGGIGIGPRGRKVLACFLEQPDVQFVQIADAQEERREIVRRLVNREYKNEDCLKVRDMYEVLARDDIDIVQVTTGDRWHTLGTILAAKAGKDVYCEKPCSMTIRETQDLANTVNRYGRVFQAGTQRRNVDNFQFAAHLARSGKLGNIHTVNAGILKLVPNADWLPEETLPDPDICDWDRWLGPAPWRPYNLKYVQGRWRGHYDFHGGAGLPEWGSHTIDLCQWAASADETVPVKYEYEGNSIIGTYKNGIKLVLRLSGFKSEGDWKVPGTCPVKFEGAEGSFELLVRVYTGEFKPFFERIDSKVIISSSDDLNSKSEAILKIKVNDNIEHTASEGVGPVHAFNMALKKALLNFYPQIKDLKLVDYKVRVLNTNEGSISKVRVLVESKFKDMSWTCVGLSDNIIEASWQAISDSLNYVLFKINN